MINLVTGRPGHGKNIYSLHWLEKNKFIIYDKETEKFTATIDRPLYFIGFTDIDIIDATVLSYKDLDDLPVTLDAELDPKFKDGAVIIVDEAHQYAAKTTSKNGFTPFVSFLKIHRHFGFDFCFITQSQKDLNLDIRNLVEHHYRVNRPFGTQTSSVSNFLGCQTTENKTPIRQSIKKFPLDKRFFSIYKSASIHNYKSSIPKMYYVYFVLVLLFAYFVVSKGIKAYSGFHESGMFGGDELEASIRKSGQISDTANITASGDPIARQYYFYKFKNPAFFVRHAKSIAGVSENVVFDVGSVVCNCSVAEINFLSKMLKKIDSTGRIKVDFFIVSMSDADFRNFNLKYSFTGSSFQLNNSPLNLNHLLLFDYLKRDYKSVLIDRSSSLLNIGYSFVSKFITQHPKILRSFKSDGLTGLAADNGVVNEEVNNTDVGLSFQISTRIADSGSVGFNIKQKHSFIIDDSSELDLPITSSREFNTSFELTENSLIPLFSLNSIVNESNNRFSIPFISALFPDNINNQKKNYQFFMSFSKVSESDLSGIDKKSFNQITDTIHFLGDEKESANSSAVRVFSAPKK